jgi:hypothetical protein
LRAAFSLSSVDQVTTNRRKPCREHKLAFPSARQSSLVRAHLVNGAVGGQKNPDDGAPHATEHRADSRRQSGSANIQTEALRWARFVERCTDSGSHTSAQSCDDEGVAQTVFVIHEFHAENVLLWNTLFAIRLPVRDRCIGDAHKVSGMFL